MPDLVFAQQEHFTSLSKAEIRTVSIRQVDFANQLGARRPHMNAVATTAVNIAGHVALDAVGDADVGEGEEPSVHQEGRAVAVDDVVGIAVRTWAQKNALIEVYRGVAVEQIRVHGQLTLKTPDWGHSRLHPPLLPCRSHTWSPRRARSKGHSA